MKPIRELVPHEGAMCLLDAVVDWDEQSIACRATSHRDPANPLRTSAGLAAVIGIEYAAQAVAAHGALTQGRSAIGYLASLRDVECLVERLDTEAEELLVRAKRIAAESGRLLYDFRLECGGRELATGRLSVVLK